MTENGTVPDNTGNSSDEWEDIEIIESKEDRDEKEKYIESSVKKAKKHVKISIEESP